MSVTTHMVNSAIAAMRDEANTTRNKWLTLEAWKTILYHSYDLDDAIGFHMKPLTRAVKLFGVIVDSKFYRSRASSTLHLHHFSKYDKDDGKKSGAGRVRFLLILSQPTGMLEDQLCDAPWLQKSKKQAQDQRKRNRTE
jgi:hypothetical protein